jgi:hypothetical protein
MPVMRPRVWLAAIMAALLRTGVRLTREGAIKTIVSVDGDGRAAIRLILDGERQGEPLF